MRRKHLLWEIEFILEDIWFFIKSLVIVLLVVIICNLLTVVPLVLLGVIE